MLFNQPQLPQATNATASRAHCLEYFTTFTLPWIIFNPSLLCNVLNQPQLPNQNTMLHISVIWMINTEIQIANSKSSVCLVIQCASAHCLELCCVQNTAVSRTLLCLEYCCVQNTAVSKYCCIQNTAVSRILLCLEYSCVQNTAVSRTLLCL